MNKSTILRAHGAPAAALLLFSVGGPLAGCGDDILGQIENRPPVADAGDDRTVQVDAYVTFDGSRSSDPDGDALSYLWDFGDDETRDVESAGFVFATPGEHSVTLTVTDPLGASDSATVTIVVEGNSAPIVDIVAPTLVEVGETFTLDGSASTDDGEIASFTWDAGGTVLSGATVEHVFSASGTFDIVLVATDDDGLTGQASHTITVEPAEVVVTDPASFSGTWSWTLVDESQRNLGFSCGTFYDSTLIVDANSPPQITFTEQAASVSNTYSGQLTDGAFDVGYSSLGIEQRIVGTFTSATAFEGIYKISPLGQPCDDRAVVGTKNAP